MFCYSEPVTLYKTPFQYEKDASQELTKGTTPEYVFKCLLINARHSRSVISVTA